MTLRVPRQACNTCPYRRDTPSGLWSRVEYEKLPDYDREFPPELAVFWCHQSNASGQPTVCRGWLAAHRDAVAVRLACAQGQLRPEDVPEDGEVETYYATGAEACAAGLVELGNPSPEARARIEALLLRGAGRWEDEDEDE